MFFEYALEPAVLSSWDRTRFFADAFGPWKGRFLARYPHRWKRSVIEGLKCRDVERKRIVERLRQLDKRVFSPRTDAQFDPERTWIENAEVEHGRQPFHAIIAAEAQQKPYILDGSNIDERHDLWRVEAGRLLPREPVQFVDALRLLLNASSRVVLIDPFFRADQDDKTRPLIAFCRHLVGKAVVEIHFSDESRGYEPCMRDAARALPTILPDGMKVTLHCWKERIGGPRLHNRYLLTEIGGVAFGDSIEMGDEGQQDHLSILDESSRASLWDQYIGQTPAFDPAGTPRVFVGGSRI